MNAMNEIIINHIVDASGLSCPFPLLQLQKKLKNINSKETVQLISTDKGSILDVRSFCEQTKHVLLKEEFNEIQLQYLFIVQKF